MGGSQATLTYVETLRMLCVLISLLHHRVFYSSINRVNIHYHRIQGFSPPLQHAQKYTNIIIIQTRPLGAHGYALIFASQLP